MVIYALRLPNFAWCWYALKWVELRGGGGGAKAATEKVCSFVACLLAMASLTIAL